MFSRQQRLRLCDSTIPGGGWGGGGGGGRGGGSLLQSVDQGKAGSFSGVLSEEASAVCPAMAGVQHSARTTTVLCPALPSLAVASGYFTRRNATCTPKLHRMKHTRHRAANIEPRAGRQRSAAGPSLCPGRSLPCAVHWKARAGALHLGTSRAGSSPTMVPQMRATVLAAGGGGGGGPRTQLPVSSYG